MLLCLQSYSTEGADREKDQLFAAWLLLEFCDEGSLQDAVDQGLLYVFINSLCYKRLKPCH